MGVTVLGCIAPVRRKINEATTPGRHVGKISLKLRASFESLKHMKRFGRATVYKCKQQGTSG